MSWVVNNNNFEVKKLVCEAWKMTCIGQLHRQTSHCSQHFKIQLRFQKEKQQKNLKKLFWLKKNLTDDGKIKKKNTN